MLIPVLFISSLIHIFSTDYMAEDPHNQRFFSYLSLFTFFMLILVSGANFFVMFIGWEGIGVVSYLLINFWFTRIQANKAAILAFTMNRVGDMGLSIGFFAMFALFGSLDFSTVFSLVPLMNETGITIIGLLLLMGAMAKSAQIPLHSWLPGSMEGPTPVSALIHAATLVTAGLYLLVRSSPLLEYSSTALLIITLVGASTAFFAATCGLVQNDLKRIIAFSTISQLGYMVMAVGLSQYNVALMHVINHAFFKALLFLGAGAVIHSFSDQQDVRRLGGLINFLPFTYTAMLVGSLSLLATPWLTGFYSKDLFIHPNNISIIEAEFSLPILIKLLPSILSLFGALLAILLYHKGTSFVIDLTETSLGRKIYTFLNGKYLFDVVYNNYITSVGLQLGYMISKVIDRGVIELLGPHGLSNIFSNTGNNISKLDSGVITTYALYITVGLLALLFLVFAPVLIDTSLLSEIRLIIIYFASLIIVLSPQIKKTN